MGRRFDIPVFYRSPIISKIKTARRESDLRKRDFTPSILDLGPVRFKIARHFGFCFGVENAIEIAFRAIHQNPGKRVFLLSEMIHNPQVNQDLLDRGVRFILSPDGEQLIPFEELTPEDIVIVPAFGTTLELFARLEAIGINPALYNATCPFVEKVWKRSEQLGGKGYTIIIHGKHYHEETRATFSHAKVSGASLVIRDMKEAEMLASFIKRERPFDDFFTVFEGRYSEGFDPERDLQRIGVVNQTTMLAYQTQGISEYLKGQMLEHFGAEELTDHFADTRDTLCYATSENQDATYGLIESGGDIAIVVGGYNSSNTANLAELCEQHVPTFYIKDAEEILSDREIQHLDRKSKEVKVTANWLPDSPRPITILLTAGASCPDALVDDVLERIASHFSVERPLGDAFESFAGSLRTSMVDNEISVDSQRAERSGHEQ